VENHQLLFGRYAMDSEVLSLLCDPDTRYTFEEEGATLRNVATGRVYPIRDGIPLFVSSLNGLDLRSQTLYDRLAPFYDLLRTTARWLSQVPDPRRECLDLLDIAPGARVLEVGVGTGASLPFLPPGIDFYGIDISWGMLRRCRSNLRKDHRQAQLFQCEAGHLPFRSSVFDRVFHMLGIHAFSSPERAVREMIWVARPGAKILIVDHAPRPTADGKAAPKSQATPLIEWIPEDMEQIEARSLVGGSLQCVTFRKPLESDDSEEA
jgi:ubiquinone/menaquinone biosynthesis C-methylase UbiE